MCLKHLFLLMMYLADAYKSIVDKSVSNIMNSLIHDFTILSQWFYNNCMVLNPHKFYFMLLAVDDEFQTNLIRWNETLKNSKRENVLGVTIANKLNFKTHLLIITKNADNKFNVLTRVQKCMTEDKKNVYSFHLLNRSSSLIWIFCTKQFFGRINSIHERCQQNYASDFKVLFENVNEKQFYQKCIELLMIEVYKYLNGLSLDMMNDIFKLR